AEEEGKGPQEAQAEEKASLGRGFVGTTLKRFR
ncbi:MAG: hypothetical protein ACI9C2_000586, partial [Gammaproteobacteria bacterium]